MQIKNYTEVLVENEIDSVMKKMNVCNCKKCKADVTAISLNSLPPKYVVTPKNICYAKLNSYNIQSSIEVTTAITKACEKVSKNPRHED